jgi:hypothetical protein
MLVDLRAAVEQAQGAAGKKAVSASAE